VTTAILFNHQRGSGREVTVNLIDSGIEIMSIAGEHISVWPYHVVDLIKHTRMAREGSFAACHDENHLLQVFEPSLWDSILERAPLAQRTEMRMVSVWWRDLLSFDIYVWVTVAGLIVVACRYAYKALFLS
jgi:hypothetical protein